MPTDTFMWNVYNNVIKFSKLLGMKTYQSLSEKELSTSFKNHGYITLQFDEYNIILVNSGEVISTINAHMKKALTKLYDHDYPNMIYICDIEYTHEPTVTKLRGILAGMDYGQDIRVRSYNTFLFNVPELLFIPKHEIMKSSKELLAMLYMKEESMKKINEYDPAVVWINGKPGDIIKIHYSSPTAIMLPEYRIVIPCIPK